MQKLKLLDHNQTSNLLNWCKKQELTTETFRNIPTCRVNKWWGYEAEFIFNKTHVKQVDPLLDLEILKLRDEFMPEANSICLSHYTPGAYGIGKHKDKKCFRPDVIVINLIDYYDLYGGRYETTKFKWDDKTYFLENGGIYLFNSRIFHSVPRVKNSRYSLQLREVLL